MLKELDLELKELSTKIRSINYGGCCVFAISLYRVLTRLGYKPSILVLTQTPSGIRDYIHAVKSLEPELDRMEGLVDIWHIVIELNGKFIDNNGVFDDVTDMDWFEDEAEYSKVYVELEILHSWDINFTHWNNRFYRGNIEEMNDRLNNIYKKLEVQKNLVSLSHN